jgi:hypothetical protein
MFRATRRSQERRLKQMVAAVHLGAWGSADDLARLDAGAGNDETEAAAAAFGLRREG